jgi:hypothetical protein
MADMDPESKINRVFLKPEGQPSLLVDSISMYADIQMVHISLFKADEPFIQKPESTSEATQKPITLPVYCQGSFVMSWDTFIVINNLMTKIRHEVEAKISNIKDE